MLLTTPVFLLKRNFRNKFEISVVLTLFLVICYYLFFVNKAWSYYYLAPVFLLVMLWLYFVVRTIKTQRQISLILLIFLGVNFWSFKSFFLESLPRDYYMPESEIVDLQLQTNEFLIKNLPLNGSTIFLDYNVSFDFRSIENSNRIQVFDYSKKLSLLNGNYGWIDNFNCYIISKKNLNRYETNRILEKQLINLNYTIFYENDICKVYYIK